MVQPLAPRCKYALKKAEEEQVAGLTSKVWSEPAAAPHPPELNTAGENTPAWIFSRLPPGTGWLGKRGVREGSQQQAGKELHVHTHFPNSGKEELASNE